MWNPFKKKTSPWLEKMIQLQNMKALSASGENYFSPTWKIIGLPTLTKGEAKVLESCLFSYNQGFDITPNILKTPQLLKKLTDKGYLRRVKRGVYELTFVKYDSDK